MERSTETHIIEKLKSMSHAAMLYAQKSHDYVFDENPSAAALFLSLAASKASAINAIYHAHYDQLQRQEVEDFLYQFDVFLEEIATNYATNHSQQWTSIQYQKLKRIFEDSSLSMTPIL